MDAASNDRKHFHEELRQLSVAALTFGASKTRSAEPAGPPVTRHQAVVKSSAPSPASGTNSCSPNSPEVAPAVPAAPSPAADLPIPNDPSIDVAELACVPCRQFFTSMHNLRQHIEGRKHKLMAKIPNDVVEEDTALANLQIFTDSFRLHNHEQERTLRDLRRECLQYTEYNRSLQAANVRVRDMMSRLETDTKPHTTAESDAGPALRKARVVLPQLVLAHCCTLDPAHILPAAGTVSEVDMLAAVDRIEGALQRNPDPVFAVAVLAGVQAVFDGMSKGMDELGDVGDIL